MSNNFGKCLGCGDYKKLIDAHIIPQGWAHRINLPKVSDDGSRVQLTKCQDANSVWLERQEQTPKVWSRPKMAFSSDQNILCEECDGGKGLGKFDEELYKVWKHWVQRRGSNPTDPTTTITLDVSRAVNAVAAILWRASISKLPQFDNVRLGPKYENTFREALFQGRQLTHRELAIIAEVYRPSRAILEYKANSVQSMPEDGVSLAASPEVHSFKLERHNIYVLYLPGFSVVARVGSPNGKPHQSVNIWTSGSSSVQCKVAEYDGSLHARELASMFGK